MGRNQDGSDATERDLAAELLQVRKLLDQQDHAHRQMFVLMQQICPRFLGPRAENEQRRWLRELEIAIQTDAR